MLGIREEIREVENGIYPQDNNVLKHAPHTAASVIGDTWNRPYAREKAAFPADRLRWSKFWPTVSRVNNTHGDRNLVCACLPIDAYMNEEANA